MELYKGLPLRTVEVINKENKNSIFGVTTENVNFLINNYYNFAKNVDKEIEEFDNSYSYAVPQDVFENADDEELVDYINNNIDDII